MIGSSMDDQQELDIGGAFSNTFDILGKHWQVPVLLAVMVYAVIGLLGAMTASAAVSGNLLGAFFFGILAVVVGLLGSMIYSGALVLFARRVQGGHEPQSIGELISEAVPFLGVLLGTAIIAGLGILVGLVLLVIPGIFLMVAWSFATIVVITEDLSFTDALKRSWEIVQGNWWRLLALMVLGGLLVGILSGIVAGIVSSIVGGDFVGDWLGDIAGSVFTPISALLSWSAYWQLTGGGDQSELPENLPPQGIPDPGGSGPPPTTPGM